jgi:hypothetical protein
MTMSFRCQDGKLTGTVDPHLAGTELQSDGDAGSALKAFFGKIALGLSGPPRGRARAEPSPSGTTSRIRSSSSPRGWRR